MLGEVKTAKSRRSLNVPQPVIESLKAHRARQPRSVWPWGRRGWTRD